MFEAGRRSSKYPKTVADNIKRFSNPNTNNFRTHKLKGGERKQWKSQKANGENKIGEEY